MGAQIEAILFYSASAVDEKELASILEKTIDEVHEVLDMLEKNLQGRGICLVRHEETVLLATAPEHAALIEKMIKEERERDLGRAGIETLAIIAYKGPVNKKEIEYIRGVNSDYALRTLMLRGLVERIASETNERSMVYTVTTDALMHLGLKHISELPEYEKIKTDLATKEQQGQENADSDDTAHV